MPARQTREGGFTLIELMVTVAIVAILAGIAIPSLSRTFRRDEVRKVSGSIAEVFHEFRGEAAASGHSMYIHVASDPTTGLYLVEAYNQPSNSCLEGKYDDIRYYDGATTSNVSVYAKDPLRGTTEVWVCLKPSGRLYEFADGFETPFTGNLYFDVQDRLNTNGQLYLVRVGMTGIAQVY